MAIPRVFLITTTLTVALAMAMVATIVPQAEATRAFFVFGDSLVDSGNNNYLATSARADSPPYGIDYPTHRPTGRFSNGYNFPDIISQSMGLPLTVPYLSPELNGQRLLNGANFASAGIGILNDTGVQFANVLRIFNQFQLFEQYQQRVRATVGADRTRQLVNGALVLITLGGNDFVNNYFLTPFSPRRRQFSLPNYCRYLVQEYRKILMRLYDLGGRRILVTGTGPIGCAPAELAMTASRNGECAPEPQRAAQIFNPELFQMLQSLNREIGSDVFITANAFAMNTDLINSPQRYGFVTSKIACCGQGLYNGLGLCTVVSNLCPNRNAYVFWDAFHPTERANRVLVQQLMTGTTEYMYPMNLSTIMALDAKL
ncbi:GDSL LIPASE/ACYLHYDROLASE FAMILY PROTEIN [Salix viminalis]|uniref:GDSL LIPASE/ACYLHYDROLASE FAMILY PROTEIN n=1 Tax=Salix viminalis TaxID=40686 RepID=A0A9Q0UFE5_SALVM|nr:GDSL LIPASE/ACYLHYDROLASE FAMILY PROTEIN [Salix viminalis]